MKKQKQLPGPFAAETKDLRFAGTYEVLVPAPSRARPHRVPLQFATRESAETWIFSQEGKEMIAEMLAET